MFIDDTGPVTFTTIASGWMWGAGVAILAIAAGVLLGLAMAAWEERRARRGLVALDGEEEDWF